MTDEREPPPLIQFVSLVAVALARKKITAMQGAVALQVALSSTGSTGRDALVNAQQIGTEVGLSERQVWRHFHALLTAGWFEQTAAPKRPTADGEGRRARYRLTLPVFDVTGAGIPERQTPATEAMSHAEDGSEPASDTLTPQRLTLPPSAPDVATPENGSVFLSGSPQLSSNPASAPHSTSVQAREAEES